MILFDSGAAVTSVNDSIESVNLRKVKGMRLEYTVRSVGREINLHSQGLVQTSVE